MLEVCFLVRVHGVDELAVIMTEDVCMNFTTTSRTEVSYAAHKTQERLISDEGLPVGRLGNCVIIEHLVEVDEQKREEVLGLLRILFAITVDQDVC